MVMVMAVGMVMARVGVVVVAGVGVVVMAGVGVVVMARVGVVVVARVGVVVMAGVGVMVVTGVGIVVVPSVGVMVVPSVGFALGMGVARMGVVVMAGVGVVVMFVRFVTLRLSHGGTPEYCITLYISFRGMGQNTNYLYKYVWDLHGPAGRYRGEGEVMNSVWKKAHQGRWRIRAASGAVTSFLILAATAVLLWLLAGTGTAHACSCVLPGTPVQELEKNAAVFAGQVVAVRHSFGLESMLFGPGDRTTVEFNVETVWKGNVGQDMTITTPPTGGSCGVPFEEGQEYLVYAYDSTHQDGGYSTGICTRTKLLAEAKEDLDELGGGNTPGAGQYVPGQDREFPAGMNASLLAFGFLIAAAAVAGWLLVNRRRSGRAMGDRKGNPWQGNRALAYTSCG